MPLKSQLNMRDITDAHPIYTVSELNREVRGLLENTLASIWLEGEISNLKAPGSGHLYFSLKDNQAQIRCALFRSRLNRNLSLKDGMHVLVQANVSLYEERGDFQLIIEHIEEIGDGALRRAFETLKNCLAAEGLFDNAHKRLLPAWPTCIGVITSPTGAAIRDILSVLKRRCAYLPIIIYPTQVQGAQAAGQIVAALELANRHKTCDVLILARGGGSLEDLWPFNEECVARAIHHSAIPIVSGVGHEVDFTIADFVADQRAPTPSAAAELVSPNIAEWSNVLSRLQLRLYQTIRHQLQHTALLLQQLEKRLPHPQRRLQDQAQKLDNLIQRLLLAQKNLLRHKNDKLYYLAQALNNVSPLNTLKRGYAIATCQGKIITESASVAIGSTIHIQLKEGALESVVKEKKV